MVAAGSAVGRNLNSCFDGTHGLCTCHRWPLCHIFRTARNTSMQEPRDCGCVSIDTEIDNEKAGIHVVCCGIGGTAVCDEVVAHHVQCRLRRIRTDTFSGDTMVGAGDDNTCLRQRGMPLTRNVDIAEEGGHQFAKSDVLYCQYGESRRSRECCRDFYGCDCFFKKCHACFFSASMRFSESPIRSRASSMLMIMTSRVSPTYRTSSGWRTR